MEMALALAPVGLFTLIAVALVYFLDQDGG
jgi:hypothetical protein